MVAVHDESARWRARRSSRPALGLPADAGVTVGVRGLSRRLYSGPLRLHLGAARIGSDPAFGGFSPEM